MEWWEHKIEAEKLIDIGKLVVKQIGDTDSEQRRDALGKKVMGIWAQAQVHATLELRLRMTNNGSH